jgi:hypothetical protein
MNNNQYGVTLQTSIIAAAMAMNDILGDSFNAGKS